MRQRIDELEKEREVSGVSQTFQDKSQRAGVTMSQYEDQGIANKSYLSSEIMWEQADRHSDFIKEIFNNIHFLNFWIYSISY